MREKNELAGIDHEAPRQRDFHSSSRLGYPRLISLGGAMNLTLMVQARHGELSDHAQMVTCHGCFATTTVDCSADKDIYINFRQNTKIEIAI